MQLVLGNQVDTKERVVLLGKDAARHLHIIGVTGSGKTWLLIALFLQILNQGIGVCLIDSAGDVFGAILGLLHDTGFYSDPRAFKRLWVIDFGRKDCFLPFNVLRQKAEAHDIARQVLEAWKRAWHAIASGAAPQLEILVLASVVVLVENQLPLTAMSRLLSDRDFRESLLNHVSDPENVKYFRLRFYVGKTSGM